LCIPGTNQITRLGALKEATGGLWVCVDIKTIPNTDQIEQHKLEVPKTQTRKHMHSKCHYSTKVSWDCRKSEANKP